MTAIPRKSPILAITHTKEDVRTAVTILETMPRIPVRTPGVSDPGFEGQVLVDAGNLYCFVDGSWKRVSLTLLT